MNLTASRIESGDIHFHHKYNQALRACAVINFMSAARAGVGFTPDTLLWADNVKALEAFVDVYVAGLIEGLRREERVLRRLVGEGAVLKVGDVCLADGSWVCKQRSTRFKDSEGC